MTQQEKEQTQANEKVSGEAEMGIAIRLVLLQTHYRKPLDFTMDKLNQAQKTLAKWHTRAVRGVNTPVPLEIYEAICDNLNTPKAIAVMHGYYAKRQGEELYAAMVFLGLVPGVQPQDLTEQEIKTPPTWEVAAASFCQLPKGA